MSTPPPVPGPEQPEPGEVAERSTSASSRFAPPPAGPQPTAPHPASPHPTAARPGTGYPPPYPTSPYPTGSHPAAPYSVAPYPGTGYPPPYPSAQPPAPPAWQGPRTPTSPYQPPPPTRPVAAPLGSPYPSRAPALQHQPHPPRAVNPPHPIAHPGGPRTPAPTPAYPSGGQPTAVPHPRRPLPRALRVLIDSALLVVCVFFALGTTLFQAADVGDWQALFVLGSFATAGTILLRRSHPVLATVAAAVGSLLLPVDNLAVLICLPWVIATRPARTVRWVGALATVAAVVALVRDALLDPAHALFASIDPVTGERTQWPVPAYVAIGLFVLTASIGSGLVRRNRHSVEQAQTAQRQLRAELTTELGRQDERDLIARELHDTVAHHLSVVSLRAAALEVSGDQAVQETAHSVRSSTHQALEEMRDLIGVLRNGQVSLTAGPGPGRSLAELPELITTARESGADIAATVFVNGGEDAPTPLTRAVYRIVQESLTNAIKHAPQRRIDLDLRAGPGIGVHLRVVNPLPVTPVDAPGSGTGLLGVRERVESVGGTVEAGPRGENWVLIAHLPWPTAD